MDSSAGMSVSTSRWVACGSASAIDGHYPQPGGIASVAVMRRYRRSRPPPPRSTLEGLPITTSSRACGSRESRQQCPRHDDALNLIGALVDLRDLCVAHHPFDREVAGVAVTSDTRDA